MSAWGITNFENDSALSWIEQLLSNKDANLIKNTILSFLSDFDAEETTVVQCSEFLAAVEVITALVGNASEEIPLELEDWVEHKYTKLEQDVFDKCVKGVELILKDSELKEMYADTGYYKVWEETQLDLIKRLKE
jgi:hypothetical protein